MSCNPILRMNIERISFSRFTLLFTVVGVLSGCMNFNKLSIVPYEVDDFALYDDDGNIHRLHYYQNFNAIVLYVVGSDCSDFDDHQKHFESYASSMSSELIRFFLIDPNPQSKRTNAPRTYQQEVPLLFDNNQIATDILNINLSNQVIIIDPRNWSVPIRFSFRPHNDLQYETIENAGKGIFKQNNLESSNGCKVVKLSDNPLYKDISFRDVAPIFKKKCHVCHRDGGIAPWAMNDYDDILGWSDMISEVVNTKRMPPWHADPKVGRFSNDISLSDDEIRKITMWIADGALNKTDKNVLQNGSEQVATIEVQDPDYIIELEEELIPPTGMVDYRYQSVQIELDQDEVVYGIEVKPGKSEVLHHIVARLNMAKEVGGMKVLDSWLNKIFFVWTPGDNSEFFPVGLGRSLPQGSTINLQLHYTAIGKKVNDRTKIGLYFDTKNNLQEYEVLAAYNESFKVPSEVTDFPVVAKYQFTDDYKLYAMYPHMHYRGKSMSYELICNGSQTEILSVPNYSFNWQRKYILEEPLSIKAGCTIHVTATYDNSAQNALNPNHKTNVKFGLNSTDEMMIGWMFVSQEN